MSPDDPRHGQLAGYVTGCRCDPCRAASTRYEKRLAVDHHAGRYRTIDATGTRRRIEALRYLGWTGVDIGREIGVTYGCIYQWGKRPRIYRTSAEKVDAAFRRLSLLPPPTGYLADRERRRARRLGFVSALAWDDLDDPAEQPKGLRTTDGDRLDTLRELDESGGTLRDVERLLGIDRDALWKWCDRHGERALYASIARRTRVGGNQWTEAAA